MKKNQSWALAPAYDICHAYRPDSIWVSQHALSLNGKRKDFVMDDFLTFAHAMNIKKAKHIIAEIQDVVKQWKRYAKEAGVGQKLTKSIEETLLVLPS